MTGNRASFLKQLQDGGPIGFGASSLGNLYRQVSDADARATVDAAWDEGVRYFDTAPFYGFGLSERRLGDALRDRLRDDYILSTKVGRLLVPRRPDAADGERFGFASPMPFDPVYDYTHDGVMRSVEASLQRLGLSRIDILFMHDLGRVTHGDAHDHYFAQAVAGGGFRAMERLRDEGVVSAVGLGVNETEICAQALTHADLDLLMIAGRYTLLNQGAGTFFDDCARRGVGIAAAGVFNSGILATGTGVATPYYDYAPAPADIVACVAEMERCCAAHGVPLPAAAMQFVMAHPAVTVTLLGTGSAARVRETMDLARVPVARGFWDDMERRGLIGA